MGRAGWRRVGMWVISPEIKPPGPRSKKNEWQSNQGKVRRVSRGADVVPGILPRDGHCSSQLDGVKGKQGMQFHLTFVLKHCLKLARAVWVYRFYGIEA